jgi:hypothetical protein
MQQFSEILRCIGAPVCLSLCFSWGDMLLCPTNGKTRTRCGQPVTKIQLVAVVSVGIEYDNHVQNLTVR